MSGRIYEQKNAPRRAWKTQVGPLLNSPMHLSVLLLEVLIGRSDDLLEYCPLDVADTLDVQADSRARKLSQAGEDLGGTRCSIQQLDGHPVLPGIEAHRRGIALAPAVARAVIGVEAHRSDVPHDPRIPVDTLHHLDRGSRVDQGLRVVKRGEVVVD